MKHLKHIAMAAFVVVSAVALHNQVVGSIERYRDGKSAKYMLQALDTGQITVGSRFSALPKTADLIGVRRANGVCELYMYRGDRYRIAVFVKDGDVVGACVHWPSRSEEDWYATDRDMVLEMMADWIPTP